MALNARTGVENAGCFVSIAFRKIGSISVLAPHVLTIFETADTVPT
jgi:hypothetical protein